MFRHSLLMFLSFLVSGCAYQFGYQSRKLPGGYRQISIPVFENKSPEVGPEAYFTNALIREFERSRVASVSSKSTAPVFLRGTVNKVNLLDNTQQVANEGRGSRQDLRYLPKNTVINTTYLLRMSISLELVRASDKKVIWAQTFNNERVFNAAQVSLPSLNTVNPLYNNSAKHQNMKVLAQVMMKEAHDRLTEKF